MMSLEEIKHQIKGEKNKSEIFIEREVLAGCPGIQRLSHNTKS